MAEESIFMRRAIELAREGRFSAAPNPMVGALVVDGDEIIGEGYHQSFGGAHAEVNAIQSVKDPNRLKSSTLYVSLEPCAHHGKTPPCADLIVQKGIPRVVIGCIDPFAKVNGQGVQKLKNAGIEVVMSSLEAEALDLNRVFNHFHSYKEPWISLKWAESQDGFLAPKHQLKGKVDWISCPETQILTHTMRASHQAILVGYKTVVNDDPSLKTYAIKGPSPLPIIWDPKGELTPDYKVFKSEFKPLLLTQNPKPKSKPFAEAVTYTDSMISALNSYCFNHNIQSILVEGGSKTHEFFIQNGMWNSITTILGKSYFKAGVKASPLPENAVLTKEFWFGSDQIRKYIRA